jgi:hypothetical protein
MSRAGDFASSRRPRVAEHATFVWAKDAAGVPISAIAHMIGCNVADVRAFLRPGDGAPAVVRMEVASTPAPKRSKPAKTRRGSWLEVRSLPEAARPTVEVFARMAQVDVDTFLGKAYPRHLVEKRAECWAVLHETGRWSLPQIGSWFGGRDHTTIMSAITRYASEPSPDRAAWSAVGDREAA